jgi:4-hydroxyacetophenone monooxygenase
VKMKLSGIPFVVVDRAGQLGGTWQANRYLGSACDIPCHYYCFSFAPNDWSRKWAPQAEILKYMNAVVDKFGVRPCLRLNTVVREMTWIPQRNPWRVVVTTPEGHSVIEANVVIQCTGQLSRPKLPPSVTAAQMKHFNGPCFHTAEWPDAVDLNDKSVVVRVAVWCCTSNRYVCPHRLLEMALQLYKWWECLFCGPLDWPTARAIVVSICGPRSQSLRKSRGR